ITMQPQSATAYAGGEARLSVTVTGTELHYQWFFNTTNALDGTDSATLVLTNVQTSQAGLYQVTVTNLSGAATSSVANLSITEADFGDAPDGYPTLLIFNGARHQIVPGVRLGALVDFEGDGQPHPEGLGDDRGGSADEDGVTFTSPLVLGRTATVKVVASTN